MLSPGIDIFDRHEHHQCPPAFNGTFYIKGLIHFTDDKKSYDVLDENFFYSGVEKDGLFLDQSDFEVYLDYNLKEEYWDEFLPKEDEYYAVYWSFKLKSVNYETACGTEYDSEIETETLFFDKADDKVGQYFED